MSRRTITSLRASLAAVAISAAMASLVRADDSSDKLKSLFDGVAGKSQEATTGGGASHLLAFGMLALGIITILVWYNARSPKPAKVKQVNHSRKLVKQISRQMGMAVDEVRQLKILADIHQRTSGQPLHNPLTLLLCPSLLTTTLNTNDVKIDRQVVSRLARRISQKAKA